MELTPDDALLLATICRYFHENGEWPTLRWLERELLSHEDIDVLELENRLHHAMFETHYPRLAWDADRRIKLTVPMMGFCLAQNTYPKIKEDLDAFVSVVRLCVSKYLNGTEPSTLADSEAQNTLGLSEEMSRKAYLLTELDFNIHGSSGHNYNERGQVTDWHFEISRDIRIYRKVQTIEDYLAERAKPPVARSGVLNPGPDAIVFPTSENADATSAYEYDVAISFAGPQRELARELATFVQNAGYRPFYDEFYTPDLWGTELTVSLDEIYRKRARYCVMFVSRDYVERMWTNHERRSAVARIVAERGNTYLLPIMVEHVEVPGIAPTISYLSLAEHSLPEIADILIAKLRKRGLA